MKTLIHGALVYDGTGEAPRAADVLIDGERIAAVEAGLAGRDIDAERVDARGRMVTPGFLDMHRHCDVAPLRDADFGTLELAQGITATTVGNCGIACVPVPPDRYADYRAFAVPVVGDMPPEFAFFDYRAYFAALEAAKPALHMGVMAATGAVRVAVKGFADTPYTQAEMARAQAHVAEAMACGALGVSLGFMYLPEFYTTPEEEVRVIAPAARAGGVLTTHVRGEGDSLAASIREVLDIARRAGIRLHISHLKATGIRNWNRGIHEAIALLEDARAHGEPVTADFYPYAGGSTTVFSLIPPTVTRQSNEGTLRYLATAAGRRALREGIAREHAGWDNMALSIGWDRILVAGTRLPEHAGYAGRSVLALAQAAGYGEPSDFICDLVVAEGGQVTVIVLSMDERDVDTVARLPYAALISDALYGGGGNPHPRLYGAFPRLIRDFVLARSILPMETAVRKMTGLPASILGLTERGLIRPGYRADVAVFDPAALLDHATYEDSRRLSTGMERLLMDGRTVWTNSHATDRHAGQVLRRENGDLGEQARAVL
ncbi:MAG: amidohydrolase family protein [Clostridiales bacterium]|nr:amidohydrolase family protein [Clostridiales bacterium]